MRFNAAARLVIPGREMRSSIPSPINVFERFVGHRIHLPDSQAADTRQAALFARGRDPLLPLDLQRAYLGMDAAHLSAIAGSKSAA
jgi:hypothetical protein